MPPPLKALATVAVKSAISDADPRQVQKFLKTLPRNAARNIEPLARVSNRAYTDAPEIVLIDPPGNMAGIAVRPTRTPIDVRSLRCACVEFWSLLIPSSAVTFGLGYLVAHSLINKWCFDSNGKPVTSEEEKQYCFDATLGVTIVATVGLATVTFIATFMAMVCIYRIGKKHNCFT